LDGEVAGEPVTNNSTSRAACWLAPDVARPVDGGESGRDTSTGMGNFRPGIKLPEKPRMSSLVGDAFARPGVAMDFSCNVLALSVRVI